MTTFLLLLLVALAASVVTAFAPAAAVRNFPVATSMEEDFELTRRIIKFQEDVELTREVVAAFIRDELDDGSSWADANNAEVEE
jgi:hypothetical protein